jgi:nicotinamide mononucleotide transporter
MMLHEWWTLLVQQIAEADWLQWTSVLLAVAEVLFAKANKIWLYPAGIGGTFLGMYVLFVAGLYAECLLSGYYLVMSVYGWWYWVKKKNAPAVEVAYCTRGEWIKVISYSIGGFVLLAVLLKNFTPSTVPVMDAFVSATAWVGMWLLAKRKIENWILLNISNLVAIPLLFYKHLALYSVLTIFLFVVAVIGYFDWKKIIENKANEEAQPAIV